MTSDTFERAMRYRDGFDPSKGEPIAWLIGIARRCIADAASSRERPVAEITLGSVASHEESSLRNLELRAAVARLGAHDRELIALRFGSDLKAKDIGTMLGMRTNAVEVALHRALDKLRAELSPPAEDDEKSVAAQWTSSTRSPL